MNLLLLLKGEHPLKSRELFAYVFLLLGRLVKIEGFEMDWKCCVNICTPLRRCGSLSYFLSS